MKGKEDMMAEAVGGLLRIADSLENMQELIGVLIEGMEADREQKFEDNMIEQYPDGEQDEGIAEVWKEGLDNDVELQ